MTHRSACLPRVIERDATVTPASQEARVPAPVRERDSVRDENCPDGARPVGASRVRFTLSGLDPHPDPLPHGRGGRSRLPGPSAQDGRVLGCRYRFAPLAKTTAAAPKLSTGHGVKGDR
ncbi:protein of unassigned function [Methylobacterium oryzae CBMB20]|uniref:Protein of unassigned function n=1 Tax=Methylobacterium oryzae CBMB20 TaxID=693986 RepID=A0A089P4E9_9HYPH|nr:protein of unassigned function [Methylobacterium oryzae CBMB20]